MKDIVLASASPRRSELLKQVGLSFRVITSDVDESVDMSLRPEELAQRLSYDKAVSVAEQLDYNAVVIGADTIVVKDGILGKPQDETEAFNMLKSLEGNWHSVITGITVLDTVNSISIKTYERTRVKFRHLKECEIHSYIKTGESLDKAGAYGIQGLGALLVERIEGCYYNVVGLPLPKLAIVLNRFGINIL